jgi:hypothetical protein
MANGDFNVADQRDGAVIALIIAISNDAGFTSIASRYRMARLYFSTVPKIHLAAGPLSTLSELLRRREIKEGF